MRFKARAAALLMMLPVNLALNVARADEEHAAEIYRHICQGCHMPQGEGAEGAGHYPALAGDPSLVSWEYIGITILRGRKGMPAFGLSAEEAKQARSVHFDDAEIAELVNYVRQHFGNHYKKSITARDISELPHPGVAEGLDE